MSGRHFRRLMVRYGEEGPAGLRDRRSGKPSPQRASAAELTRMPQLYRDFTVKHFHEQLEKRHDYKLGYTVTRLSLQGAGLGAKTKRGGAHRQRRERRPLPCMMLLQDGSSHHWIPALAHALDLVVTLDDATGELSLAILVEEEGTASSFLGLAETIAKRGLFRALAMRRSLCPSSSSVCKHWKLVCRHDAIRTTCSPNRGSHPFLLQVVGTDLVGSARHNLLGGEDAGLDEPADAVVRNSERRGCLGHREPFAVLLGRTVGMNSVHPAHRADTVRSPGFSLTGGHSHPVQGRGDVLVRPSGRHGPHHREGLLGGAAAMLAGLRLADPQL
jgi:hypothetical protein